VQTVLVLDKSSLVAISFTVIITLSIMADLPAKNSPVWTIANQDVDDDTLIQDLLEKNNDNDDNDEEDLKRPPSTSTRKRTGQDDEDDNKNDGDDDDADKNHNMDRFPFFIDFIFPSDDGTTTSVESRANFYFSMFCMCPDGLVAALFILCFLPFWLCACSLIFVRTHFLA
jgi:hypothetical protein